MKHALACSAVLALLPAGAAGQVEWRTLEPGLELGELAVDAADGVPILIVRADPAVFELALVGSGPGAEPDTRSARQWADAHGLLVATNAGMFATDYRTHLGYLEARGEVRSRSVGAYLSVAAFDARASGAAPFRIFDLDAAGVTLDAIRRDYSSLVQNLRLVRRPGENRWSPQPRRWSEAALGEDASGRPLLVHSRTPFSMHELNRILLGSGIGLVAAQHLEGGPEAQLYLRAGGAEVERVGSFETGFFEDDTNRHAWPVPHVLGLRRRAPD